MLILLVQYYQGAELGYSYDLLMKGDELMQEMADIFGKTVQSFEEVKSAMVQFIADNPLNHLELGFEKALRTVDRFHLAVSKGSLVLCQKLDSMSHALALPSNEAVVTIVRELGSVIFEYFPDNYVRIARVIFTAFSSAPEQTLVKDLFGDHPSISAMQLEEIFTNKREVEVFLCMRVYHAIILLRKSYWTLQDLAVEGLEEALQAIKIVSDIPASIGLKVVAAIAASDCQQPGQQAWASAWETILVRVPPRIADMPIIKSEDEILEDLKAKAKAGTFVDGDIDEHADALQDLQDKALVVSQEVRATFEQWWFDTQEEIEQTGGIDELVKDKIEVAIDEAIAERERQEVPLYNTIEAAQDAQRTEAAMIMTRSEAMKAMHLKSKDIGVEHLILGKNDKLFIRLSRDMLEESSDVKLRLFPYGWVVAATSATTLGSLHNSCSLGHVQPEFVEEGRGTLPSTELFITPTSTMLKASSTSSPAWLVKRYAFGERFDEQVQKHGEPTMQMVMLSLDVPDNELIKGFQIVQPYLELNRKSVLEKMRRADETQDSNPSEKLYLIELTRAPFESERKRKAAADEHTRKVQKITDKSAAVAKHIICRS